MGIVGYPHERDRASLATRPWGAYGAFATEARVRLLAYTDRSVAGVEAGAGASGDRMLAWGVGT